MSEEPEPEEQKLLTKRDNSTTRGVTGSRNYRVQGTVKRNAVTTKPRELPKVWKQYQELKRLFNKISGNYQFNFSRLKSVFLRKKEAYFESIPCKRKQMNWEYAQICMYECEMARNCMIVRNFKLYVWNWYSRKYALFGDNDVCMMHNKASMHTMIVLTAIWNLYSNELKYCKVLVYVCEYMRCSKICNSIIWVRNNVIYCLCVMKYAYSVWKAWYVLESKNYTFNIYFYSKAKIQPSRQIKLWGGNGLRENRSKTHTKLWKFFYLLLILWYIGEKMATISATNVDMEMGMVNENEINSSSQKRPTMAQVTISQKKAKGKLVTEPKCPPF